MRPFINNRGRKKDLHNINKNIRSLEVRVILDDGEQLGVMTTVDAIELAKNRLVGLLETNMKAVIESDVANNQLNASDAVSVTKTIEVSANRVAKKLQRVNPLFKVYRNVKKNIEVQVLIGYSYDLAAKAMQDELKLQLQNETEDVRKKHEKFLNPETYKTGNIINYAPSNDVVIVK